MIQAAELNRTAPQIYKNNCNFLTDEYLLIKNWQQLLFDADMPDLGLTIYHIDEMASKKR
jgi:hypothetical protein